MCVLLICLVFPAHSTSIAKKELSALVFEADHALIAKVVKVDMVEPQFFGVFLKFHSGSPRIEDEPMFEYSRDLADGRAILESLQPDA